MKCESCVTLCQLRFFGATLAAATSVSLRQDDITPRRCEQQTDPMAGLLRTPLGRETRTRDPCCDSLAGIGFTATYKNAGTAKIPVRRTRLHELWVGLWVGMARTLLSSYCESRPIESDLKLVRRPYCGVIHVSAWRRCLSQKCADKKMRVCGGYRKMTAHIPVHSNRWLIPDVTPRIALSGNQ